ncbi:Guanine nucleotide exchange factor for Cdc42p, partial [Coemansia spiralis]
MLIKPVQRICKYPMMMEELTKFYDKASPIYTELRDGIVAINSIVEQVNEAERREDNLSVVSDLEGRVEDWKGYSINSFGELFLHDSFVMSTTGVERVLLIYLFEHILICCKEVSDKDKRRTQKHRSNALQLKGRIFLFSIHSVVDTSREGNSSLTIYWRDVALENFSLACRSEEQLRLWKTTMERLIQRTKERPADQSQVSPTALQMQRSITSQHGADSYESEDDTTLQRRGRYSEGSSLTASMQQEKTAGTLSYRKTYDGGASRPRTGIKKTSSGSGDYQTELIEGMERSATIGPHHHHRRQGTSGSGSTLGDPGDAAVSRGRASPMASVPYFAQQSVPPVPPVYRGEGEGSMPPPYQHRAPGMLGTGSTMPTAFSSAISPITPNVVGA